VADARVIPIDGDRPRRRASTASAADAVAAGASRASGERARGRRSSPLLAGADPAGTSLSRSRRTSGTRRTGGTREPAAADAGREPPPPADPLSADASDGTDGTDGTGGRPPAEWEQKAAAALAFLRRRLTGEVEVDEFGFDPELTDAVLLRLMRPLYDRYFRVEVRGLENVPSHGGALVVANHSGTIPLDSVMTQIALREHHPARRHLRMLGADLIFQTPFVGEVARKTGTTLACNADAERLLSKGELVGVWPEGFKGIGKPFSERYKLQRFGRGGFVSAALRTGVPIVPCAIVGAEEIYPVIGNMRTVARLLGLPYVPVTPTFPWLGPLGAIPLPSKWIIEFGEPIDTTEHGPGAAEDPMLVFNITDQVRETIQHALYRLLMDRRSVFF
jgi:1-acyl-sn-glycerol-3-phosphate acyltransferase